MTTNFVLRLLTALFAIVLGGCLISVADGDRLFNRPVAAVLSHDGGSVLIANQGLPLITVIDTTTFETRQINSEGSGFVDMALLPRTTEVVAVQKSPPLLVGIQTSGESTSTELVNVKLDAVPAKVAISMDGKWACVSMTWDHSVRIVRLAIGDSADADEATRVPLEFQPKHVLALPSHRFLVADAFGGGLAVVDGQSLAVVALKPLTGHHIGGLVQDATSKTVYISHQRLSRIAQTNQDDIHWGSLIQNGVTAIAESELLQQGDSPAATRKFRSLGDTGNGAGDPAGMAILDDGDLAVALAGTNQVAVLKSNASTPRIVDVGRMPTDVLDVGAGRLLCTNTLSDMVSIIDTTSHLQVSKALGEPRELKTTVERGEAAYFSAGLSHDGWMSCNSCHVDGHTCGLVADTLGDGNFGNPKRIPSLLNVSKTGPWGWDGTKKTLHQQVTKTLRSTMHRDHYHATTDESDAVVSEDIVAYLNTLTIPEISNGPNESVTAGRAVFTSQGCSKCHDPAHGYTSDQTYNVGVTDELGQEKFNPPSLAGLRYRHSFFHDGRFETLDRLLDAHPVPKSAEALTANEKNSLKAFLMSLPVHQTTD